MSEDQEQYVVAPVSNKIKECLGPFDCPKEARNFADHYFAGQVNFQVLPLWMPPEEPPE